MTITYDVEGSVLVIHQNGETDPQQIARAIGTALTDPALPPGASMLWDARSAPAQASAATMKRMLQGFAGIGARLSRRFALLVASDLQFGVSRMLATYAEGYGIEVCCFYDPEAARAWLLQAS
jgi:hypothetical protein